MIRRIDKIQKFLETSVGEIKLNICLWGNSSQDLFKLHFEYIDVEKYFNIVTPEDGVFIDIVLIIGLMNAYHQEALFDLVDDLPFQPRIISMQDKNQLDLLSSNAYSQEFLGRLDVQIQIEQNSFSLIDLFDEILKKRFESEI